jgi:hypothetical protein
VISASSNKATAVARSSEAAIRMICRAVIRRVQDENPESSGYELFLRCWAACPFGPDDELMQGLYHEEVLRAVAAPTLYNAFDYGIEPDTRDYTASPYIQ